MIRRQFLKIGAALPVGLWLTPEHWGSSLLSAANHTVAGAVSAARTLPQWFLAARVQGHTRLGPRYRNRPEFTAATALFDELGVDVITRHVKMASEPPGWPTRAGKGDQRDYAREIIQAAHGEGLKIITYNWIMSEEDIQDSHPDWVCRDNADKATAHRKRGAYLDVTGPYREIILTRLLELAERGSDGFYFDNEHLPGEGCWGTAVEREFERATGKNPPRRINENDADYRAFVDFQAQRIVDTFTYWQNAVHAKYPNVVFIVSTTSVVSLFGRSMTTRLAAVVDSPKTEYDLALRPGLTKFVYGRRGRPGMFAARDDVRLALGWAVLRDSASGRPPHVGGTGFANSDASRAFAGAVITWGGIATIDLDDNAIVDRSAASMTQRRTVSEAAKLGNAAGPILAQMRPLRWAAIHFPEAARNEHGGDFARAAREVISPMVNAFGTLVDNGLPTGIVTDDQLSSGALAEYRVLFLPAPDSLTQKQKQAVEAFRARGGLVVRNTWSWVNERSVATSSAALLAALRSAIAEAPVRVSGLPAGAHAVPYRNDAGDAFAVAITNRFDWVKEQNADRTMPANQNRPAALRGIEVHTRPGFRSARDAVTGSALRTVNAAGGSVIAVPTIETLALVVTSS